MFVNLVDKINEVAPIIAGSYPNSFFYEVESTLSEDDNGVFGPDVDLNSTKLIWGTRDGKTVVVTFDKDGAPQIDLVSSPWCEDLPTIPYLHMDLTTALDFVGKANYSIANPMFSYRHSLAPGCVEPHYYFKGATTESGEHTFISVGVYSGDVKVVE